MGVASGIVMSVQFGTTWSVFSFEPRLFARWRRRACADDPHMHRIRLLSVSRQGGSVGGIPLIRFHRELEFEV